MKPNARKPDAKKRLDHSSPNVDLKPIPPSTSSLSWARELFLVFAILLQVIAVVVSWEVWSIRSGPPNLPMWNTTGISMGWLMLVSAGLPLLTKRWGPWIHLCVLVVACGFDQFRLQPQFFFGWAFIWAASEFVLEKQTSDAMGPSPKTGEVFCRWLLASLWFWAGLHKLLSPEWLGVLSYRFLAKMQLFGQEENLTFSSDNHFAFGVAVALSELVLGLIAIFKPRIAAFACIPIHLGIIASLLKANWNFSVIPWNLGCIGIGLVVLIRAHQKSVLVKKDWLFAIVLFVVPALFYVGVVDRCFAHVLYSGMTPQGFISHVNEEDLERPRLEMIYGWGDVAVPFPQERRCLRQYFRLTASSGSKLHLLDPRSSLDDEYWVKSLGGIKEISEEDFYSAEGNVTRGFGFDYPQSIYVLTRAKATQRIRSADEAIFAVEFVPEEFSPDLLPYLALLPNVEEVQFAGCDLTNEDLVHLKGLRRLQGIGLTGTQVTDDGLKVLEHLSNLYFIEYSGEGISKETIQAFRDRQRNRVTDPKSN